MKITFNTAYEKKRVKKLEELRELQKVRKLETALEEIKLEDALAKILHRFFSAEMCGKAYKQST